MGQQVETQAETELRTSEDVGKEISLPEKSSAGESVLRNDTNNAAKARIMDQTNGVSQTKLPPEESGHSSGSVNSRRSIRRSILESIPRPPVSLTSLQSEVRLPHHDR